LKGANGVFYLPRQGASQTIVDTIDTKNNMAVGTITMPSATRKGIAIRNGEIYMPRNSSTYTLDQGDIATATSSTHTLLTSVARADIGAGGNIVATFPAGTGTVVDLIQWVPQ